MLLLNNTCGEKGGQVTDIFEKYWRFDTEAFIKDYPNIKEEIQQLEFELLELTEVRGRSFDSSPSGTKKGDSVASTVEKKEKIETKIKECQEFVDTYQTAYLRLTEEEKAFIHYFFHAPGTKSSNVRFLQQKFNIEISEVYRRRRRAIEAFARWLGVKNT